MIVPKSMIWVSALLKVAEPAFTSLPSASTPSGAPSTASMVKSKVLGAQAVPEAWTVFFKSAVASTLVSIVTFALVMVIS